MREALVRFYQYWTQLTYFRYILFSLFLTIIATLPLVPFFVFFDINDKDIGGPKSILDNIYSAIIVGLIIAPIIETLTTQLLPIKIVQKYIKWNTNSVALVSSSIIFGLGHLSYSFWYFLLTLPLGFVLAVTYLTFQKRKQSSFWTTTLLHSMRNALGILANIDEIMKNL
jgi:membrane protease YdiL (CAAX protease family)